MILSLFLFFIPAHLCFYVRLKANFETNPRDPGIKKIAQRLVQVIATIAVIDINTKEKSLKVISMEFEFLIEEGRDLVTVCIKLKQLGKP
ncbi:hypothetical protein E2542_SST27833 [Spatholobus suberectus]|nr:hypothetical protein E2542_SST27833 [Spatholobus suberectus]